MNKAELIDALAEKTGLKKTESKDVLESLIDVIKESLHNGEKVQLVGFGSWVVVARAARKGRNPQSGEEIDIPAKNAVKFKAGKGLNEYMN